MIQCQYINKLLRTKDLSTITLNNLNEEFFSDYKEEWKYIKEHIDKYNTIPDVETFLTKFPDFDIIDVKENINYLIEELYNDRNKRQLAKIFNKVRDLINEDKTEEAIKLYTNAANDIVTSKKIECVDILKDTTRYDKYIEKTKDFNKYYIKTGFEELDNIIGGWDREEELATIVARPGVGKCLAKGTEVLMADGTLKNIETIKIGDKVQSENTINNVIATHNGVSKGYKIIPICGESFIVSANHILTLMKRNTIWDSKKKISTTNNTFELVDMSIEEYLKLSKSAQHKYLLYRPAVEYSTKELPIPPYILGIWLGDGTSCRPEITNMDNEVINEWCAYGKSIGLNIHISNNKSKANIYTYTTKGTEYSQNIFTNALRELNILNNKHIPLQYLTGDKAQRTELLAGILDSDGYRYLSGYELTSKSLHFIKQVRQLASGLGFKCGKISKKHIKKYSAYAYQLHISNCNASIPCRVNRKKFTWEQSDKHRFVLSNFTVESIDVVEYYGFECDGDHRFLLGDNTLTHNSWVLQKIAIEAAKQGLAVGLYSGEMTETKVGYRVDTLISNISNTKLIHGNDDIQVQYKRYIEELPNKIKGSIKVLTPSMINGIAGVTALRAFIEKEKLDILCIDQHSLLDDDRKARNPIEKASNISKDLKTLQVLKKIPIISISQQNRVNTENGQTTSHVAQTDRISQDSTILIFLEKKEDILTLNLVKSRDSGNGAKLQYAIDLDKGIFRYIPNNKDKTDDLIKEYEEDEGEDIY